MKEIQLSQRGKNKGKFVALVDDEDFEALNQYKWYANKAGNTLYVIRQIRVDERQKAILMHVEIMNRKWIDHIDGNGCNNQKTNLRFCTHKENMMNKRKQAGTSSIYKGVHFFKLTNGWMARIMISGKRIYLGVFADEAEAARAYNRKAIELFGEFANLNIIQ